MYESDDKMVSHPIHYQSKSGLEVIDVIKAFTEDLAGYKATDTGNIIKYACRWNQKGGKQDIKKIIWYAQHLLDEMEKEEPEETITEYFSDGKKIDEKAVKYLNDMEPATFTCTAMFDEDELWTLIGGDYSDTKKFVAFNVEEESEESDTPTDKTFKGYDVEDLKIKFKNNSYIQTIPSEATRPSDTVEVTDYDRWYYEKQGIKDTLDTLYEQCEILMCKINQMRRINAELEK